MCLFQKKRKTPDDGFSYDAMLNAVHGMIGGSVPLEGISTVLEKASPEEVEALIKHVKTFKFRCANEGIVLKSLGRYPDRVYRFNYDRLLKESEGTIAESTLFPEMEKGGKTFFILYHNNLDEFGKVRQIATADFILYCYEFNSVVVCRNILRWLGK